MADNTVIVFFLLCVIADMPATSQTLEDVCATCHANATCEEKADLSGKVCNCKYGFVGNGRSSCQDKDECQIGAVKMCGQHTTCHNTYGSFYCTCLHGYHPSNNLPIFIPNDGTHCQDIDECRISGLCGEGGQCRNLDGSFDCSCRRGYQVHDGTEPFHPHQDQAFCKVVDCGQPAPLQGSVLLSATGTTYGSVAVFECGDGFLWRGGVNTSLCGADGQWRGRSMRCEGVDCGPPPAFPHSFMLWNRSSRMGSQVRYQCNSGYHNSGQSDVSTCTSAGQWTGASLLCQEILCGNPPVIESSEQVWDGNSTPGSSVVYLCKDGFYNKGGHHVSICSDSGQWTTPTLSCQAILCGDPPVLPHTSQVWNGSSTPGSMVTYYCKTGFYHSEGDEVSLCTTKGYWTEPKISCTEVDCGAPPDIPHSILLWDQSSTVGSQALYHCLPGYRSVGQTNVSICTGRGDWDQVSLQCQEISCGPPLTPPHTNLLWDRTSRPSTVVLYECVDGFHQETGNAISTCQSSGEWTPVSVRCRAKCGPVPFLARSEVVWRNGSLAMHRCVEGYRSWRGTNVSVCSSSGVWLRATLTCIEIKPPISHLYISNEKCLHWRAEKYEEDTEVYKVTYSGTRDYERTFHDRRKQLLSSRAKWVEVCLDLLPVTNYSISITAVSAQFTASISTNTSLTEPPAAPVVYYREFETPAPTLRLRRSPDALDAISFYQVLVLPVEGVVVFTCSSGRSEYIAAQIHVSHITTAMNFTVGDGRHYGGFLNAPLENGRNYYIILRAVSQWKRASKSLFFWSYQMVRM